MTENQEEKRKKINSFLTQLLKSPSKNLMGFFYKESNGLLSLDVALENRDVMQTYNFDFCRLVSNS